MPERNERESLWTAEQVASFLGLHPKTVYEKAREGTIPSRKIGQARRFVPAEIEAWVDEQESAPAEKVG